MFAIDVSSELLEPLQRVAAERGESVNTLVEQLIADYLRDRRHRYLTAEMERFREHHDELRQQYEGQFIALREGKVLDHDPEGGRLYGRIHQQYGDIPVLIVEVNDQPEQLFTRLTNHISL